MHVVPFPPEVPGRAATPPRPIGLAGRGAGDLILVASIVALTLGLGVVAASLKPEEGRFGAPAWGRPSAALAGDGAADDPARILDRELAGSPVAHGQPANASAPASLGRDAGGPWPSPLYPRNGVSLWDRIRVSAWQDRRAFLLGAAVQLHTPETAATPGPRAPLAREVDRVWKPLNDAPG